VSVSYPQNVPENFKRFSGAWVGAWGEQLHHFLVVESIMADGTANIVYAVGDNPAANVQRRWGRLVATIVGNTLRAGFATYELTVILEARNEFDIDAALATLVKSGAGALVVGPYVLFSTYRNKIVELAARHKIYPHRYYADAGGLMSYDADVRALSRLIGSLYVAQILKGDKPADLPVQQPTKFELVINLKTAKALGLTVPPRLLALADEVIE
jgi:hypothetical protein